MEKSSRDKIEKRARKVCADFDLKSSVDIIKIVILIKSRSRKRERKKSSFIKKAPWAKKSFGGECIYLLKEPIDLSKMNNFNLKNCLDKSLAWPKKCHHDITKHLRQKPSNPSNITTSPPPLIYIPDNKLNFLSKIRLKPILNQIYHRLWNLSPKI